jgi:hypothetical protein
LPHTPTLASSVSNAGGSRPDRFGDGRLDTPDPARWLDASFNTAGARPGHATEVHAALAKSREANPD